VQPTPNAFELYGVDFLVAHVDLASPRGQRFEVKLLEVNAEPAIELTGPRLTWILEDLFTAMGKVCVEPFIQGTSPDTTWGVGQTRHFLRKCLKSEVRGAAGW
jgi:tubulin---tyrosine ligase